MGLLGNIKKGLQKTRSMLQGRLGALFSRRRFDDDFYAELEEILIGADVGLQTSLELVEKLRENVQKGRISEPEQVVDLLKEMLLDILGKETVPLAVSEETHGYTYVGVNGVAKPPYRQIGCTLP